MYYPRSDDYFKDNFLVKWYTSYMYVSNARLFLYRKTLVLAALSSLAVLMPFAMSAGPTFALAYGARLISRAAADRFYPSIKTRHMLAQYLSSSVEEIQALFELPPNSSKIYLMGVLENIEIPMDDSEGLIKRRRALAFLEANDFAKTEGDISTTIVDLLYLARRYGHGGFFPYISDTSGGAPFLGDFSRLLQHIKGTKLYSEVKGSTLSNGDRGSLTTVLTKDLTRLGFASPHPINLSRHSIEDLTSWAFIVRLSMGYFDEHPAAQTMAPLAFAIIDVAGSGKSRHFFGPANDSTLYHLIFDEWGADDLSSWMSFLQRAAEYRRQNRHASMMEALMEIADENEVGMKYFFLSHL